MHQNSNELVGKNVKIILTWWWWWCYNRFLHGHLLWRHVFLTTLKSNDPLHYNAHYNCFNKKLSKLLKTPLPIIHFNINYPCMELFSPSSNIWKHSHDGQFESLKLSWSNYFKFKCCKKSHILDGNTKLHDNNQKKKKLEEKIGFIDQAQTWNCKLL